MNKRGLLIIAIVGFLGGIIVVRQFLLSEKIHNEIKPETNQALAYEVSELFKSNEKLIKEVDKLTIEVGKLQKTYEDSKSADQALNDKLNNYKIILGSTEVEGQGVKIEFDKKVASTNLIDLMNSLKNIGVDAISVNGQRVITSTSFSEGIFSPPIIVYAIGDRDLLYSSLTRTGGIIEQIGFGNVVKQDNIILSGS